MSDCTVHGILQARILELGSLSLLQWLFLAQESNWALLHCRQILYQLSYEGSPVQRKKEIHKRKKKGRQRKLTSNKL